MAEDNEGVMAIVGLVIGAMSTVFIGLLSVPLMGILFVLFGFLDEGLSFFKKK